MASIEISAVRKAFGSIQVLHGIDLAVADGEFIVLVGPSGCGKSTLLRMIAGLEAISAGTIRIGGDARMDETGGRRTDSAEAAARQAASVRRGDGGPPGRWNAVVMPA